MNGEAVFDDSGQIINNESQPNNVEPGLEQVTKAKEHISGLFQVMQNGSPFGNAKMMEIFVENLFKENQNNGLTPREVGQAFMEFQKDNKKVVGLFERAPTESDEYELGM